MVTTNRSSFCTCGGSSMMVNWLVPAVFQWDLVYFAKMSKQSSCHIQGSVILSRAIWWHTMVMSHTWKVQDRSTYHGWEYRGVFSLLPKPTQSSDSPSVKCWEEAYGEDNDIIINSSSIVCLTVLSCSMRKIKEYPCMCLRVVAGLESWYINWFVGKTWTQEQCADYCAWECDDTLDVIGAHNECVRHDFH